jgi:5'-3' exonuclease
VSQDSKIVTQEERRQKRKEARLKRDALFEELSTKDILELSDQEIKKWKNSVGTTTGMSRSGTSKLKEFTKHLGIPTITSDDEAENLASSLSVERKVSVVWSNDTDNYPLGAERVACQFSYRKGKINIKGIEPRKIPSHLGWDFKTFRDFCILLGTDFNKRIKGMGPKTCRKLIDRYKTIETVDQETKHNFTFHNYKNVRKQLTPYSTYYQMDYHFKAQRCHCPDKIEELEKAHPELNIRRMISSINELHFKGSVVSPIPKTPIPPSSDDEEKKENREGSEQFLENVKIVEDDESSLEGSPQMKSVGE